MKAIPLALAAALLVAGTPAAAQTAAQARCIVLAHYFANQAKNPNQQKIAEDTLYFYLGRIAGQPTAAQMKAATDEQRKTLTDANAGAQMAECVKAVQAKVQILQTIAAQSQATPPPQAKPPAQPEGR